jgi:hypothetical protein
MILDSVPARRDSILDCTARRSVRVRRCRIQNPIQARRDKVQNVACLVALAVCATSAFAESPKPEKAVDGTRYLPLIVGREMRYQVTVTPPIGKARKATATNKTVEKTTLNGKTYYKVTTSITGVPFMPDTLIYYRSTVDGVYQVLEGDEKSPEWLYLPATIEIGDLWGAKTPSGDFEFEALGLEDVVTPSGKYPKCLKLSVAMKTTLATNNQVQWLAPGVGSVKQTDINAIFSATTILEEVKESQK